VILLAAAAVLWRAILAADSDTSAGDRLLFVRRLSAPLSVFAAGLGLGLFGISAGFRPGSQLVLLFQPSFGLPRESRCRSRWLLRR
jgi:hypothetical protein